LKIFRKRVEVSRWSDDEVDIGLIPTMGALHEGHLSLLRAARERDRATLVSIFVNPTQFGPNEDYTAYPRDETKDVALLEANGADAVFIPSLQEMYPPGETTRVHPGPIADRLEGAARPGHFVGVATVVAKLFAIAKPKVAYFGQKDYQQLRVIQTMARDLRFEAAVVGCPIVREPDGLAMSSRNAYLSPEQRRSALALSRGLFAARDRWQGGNRDPELLRALVRQTVSGESGVELEYVSAADPMTLAELPAPSERMVISLAARVGRARLIDNALLGMDLSDL
jgi:pantoate--beta-alanine ligase